nr:hypothetical protein [Tanacetum cinerariifolium]
HYDEVVKWIRDIEPYADNVIDVEDSTLISFTGFHKSSI